MIIINIIIKINNIANKRLNFDIFNVFDKSKLNLIVNDKYQIIDKKIMNAIKIQHNSNIKIHKFNKR